MARTMTNVTPVRITTDELNCYATIERSCISAITACLRMEQIKGKHINPQLNKLREVKSWAQNSYDQTVDKYLAEAPTKE